MTPRKLALIRARRGTPEEKFWARVHVTDGCWFWLGALSTWGYGTLTVAGRTLSAHRLSWEINRGQIPEGLHVCHQCDIRDCVNPGHLFLGTAKDNVADMNAKGRHGRGWRSVRRGQTHQAAKLSDDQVSVLLDAVASGTESQRAIGRRFGVSHTYVGMLARGERRI